MTEFILDKRLEADTLPVVSMETSQLRLMNDSRWLWLILVPRIEDAVEWHELFSDQRQDIDLEIANVAGIVKGMTGCEKINIASLGNTVRQLHIHVVARNTGDPNWPAPVWGFGEKTPYSSDGANQIIDVIRSHMGV
ncbi:MAG: HIT domain-containing protein [Pseudomonadota bacterium]